MRYTLAIVALILGYMWVADPLVDAPGPWPLVAGVVVLSLAIAHNRKSGDWGFSRQAFAPALLWSIGLTVPLVAALWLSAMRRDRRRSGPLPCSAVSRCSTRIGTCC